MAHLMIVDDDEDFATAAATALRGAGHEVEMETDVDRAIAHMEAKPPELLVLDVMFPDDACGGFELARSLRSREDPLSKIPILMLTGINTEFPLGFGPQDIDDAWLPVSDFLEKPVDFRVLRKKVETMLAMQPD
jgi:DNA-binding response OmpR family regulator